MIPLKRLNRWCVGLHTFATVKKEFHRTAHQSAVIIIVVLCTRKLWVHWNNIYFALSNFKSLQPIFFYHFHDIHTISFWVNLDFFSVYSFVINFSFVFLFAKTFQVKQILENVTKKHSPYQKKKWKYLLNFLILLCLSPNSNHIELVSKKKKNIHSAQNFSVKQLLHWTKRWF